MKLQFKLSDGSNIRSDAVFFYFFQDPELFTKCWQQCTAIFPDAQVIQNKGTFKGEFQKISTQYLPNAPATQIFCIGLGKLADFHIDKLRQATAAATRMVSAAGYSSIAALPASVLEQNIEEVAHAITEGIILGNYKFDWFFSSEEKKQHRKLQTLLFCHPERSTLTAIRKAALLGQCVSEATILCRDLANAPNNAMYPEKLAETTRKIFRNLPVKVTVFSKNKIEQLKMAGLLAVNKGSARPPVFIILEYKGNKKQKNPIVLVGKGVTFDTGGISLKPAPNMGMMRMDMHGAASVIGTVYAAAKAKLPVSLVGLIPATENMPGGNATVPGDVIVYNNGLSVEIDNTDAEGRLILADALLYAKRYTPNAVIDLATLTGACVIALGHVAAGMMGTSAPVKELLKQAGDYTSEYVWELPLYAEYEKQLESQIADIKNVGGRPAGAITAAMFLKKFVEDAYPWVHLDIAGVAMGEKERGYVPAGATGFGVRLLFHALQNWKDINT